MRRAFTLIELLTALGLLSVLLTSLFFWYGHISGSREQVEKLVWPARIERYADQRLSKILPKAKEHFGIQEEALIFTFDNGPHPEPLLSGDVRGKLYLSDHGSLCLGIWPLEETAPSETMTLLPDASGLSFDFYFPPQTRLIVNPEEVGKKQPTPGWQPSWDPEYEALPAMMTLTVSYKGHERTFAYDFETHPIIQWRAE